MVSHPSFLAASQVWLPARISFGRPVWVPVLTTMGRYWPSRLRLSAMGAMFPRLGLRWWGVRVSIFVVVVSRFMWSWYRWRWWWWWGLCEAPATGNCVAGGGVWMGS